MQVIGHRGAAAYAPENTMASFHRAQALGVRSLETDIRMSRDGVAVLCHDADLGRTSDGVGPLADRTYEQLRELDFGAWFSPEFRGETIVTLDEFLDAFGGRMHLALELKAPNLEALVLERIDAHGLEYGSFTITSFDFPWLVRVGGLDPRVHMGYLTSAFDEKTMDQCLRHGIREICPAAAVLNGETVAMAHGKNLRVRAWGVKTIALMEHAAVCGVDGMTVDFPDRLMEYLRDRG